MREPPADVRAGAAAYEHYAGRWSRLVAQNFIRSTRVQPRRSIAPRIVPRTPFGKKNTTRMKSMPK